MGYILWCVGALAAFSRYNLLDLIQFVERVDGREVVDVKAQDLIPYLFQYRVIELEDAHLHALATISQSLSVRFACRSHRCVVGLKLLQDDLRALHNAARHTRYLSHMDTKRVL